MPRTERIDKRTARSKTFDNGDGTFTLEAGGPHAHYQPVKGGGWEDIDCVLYGGNTEVVDPDTGEKFTHSTDKHPIDIRINKFKQGVKFKDRASGVMLVLKPIGARQVTGLKSLNTVSFGQPWDGIDVLFRITPEGLSMVYTKTAEPCADPAWAISGDVEKYHGDSVYMVDGGVVVVPHTLTATALTYDFAAVPVGTVVE